MKKLIVVLILVMSANCFAQTKVGELPELVNPFPVVVDGNDLIFIDEYTIYVYSINPFEMKAKFAKQGDGPHDLKYKPHFIVQDNAIIATDYLKSIWFSKVGDVIKVIDYKDFPDFDTSMEMVLIPIKENYIRITVSHELKKRYVDLYNSKFEKIKRLYEGLYDWQASNGGINPLSNRIDVTCYEEKIFITDTEKGFFIKVYDYKGNELIIIDKNKEIDEIPITEGEKRAIEEYIKTNHPDWLYNGVKANPFYYKNYPKMNYVMVSDEQIYVTTHKKKENLNEIIILDLKGKIIDRVFHSIEAIKLYRRILRFDPYTVNNGKLYEILKNKESDFWGFYAIDIK